MKETWTNSTGKCANVQNWEFGHETDHHQHNDIFWSLYLKNKRFKANQFYFILIDVAVAQIKNRRNALSRNGYAIFELTLYQSKKDNSFPKRALSHF